MLRIKTPDQLGKQAKEKMAAWKRKKKMERKKPEPEKIKEKAKPISEEQKDLGFEFRKAARFGHLEKMQELLDKGVEIDSKSKTNAGGTALVIAATNRQTEVVKFLIGHGADVNASNAGGDTVLMQVSKNRLKEIVELLIQNGVDINARDDLKETALKKIRHSLGVEEIKELLKKHGATE